MTEPDKVMMTDIVRRIPTKRSFFRWVMVCLETCGLSIQKDKNGVCDLTPEGKIQVRDFIEIAVSTFNDTHNPSLYVDINEVYEEIDDAWKRESLADDRARVIPR